MSWKNYTRSHENNGNRPSSELFMIRKRLFLRATIYFFSSSHTNMLIHREITWCGFHSK